MDCCGVPDMGDVAPNFDRSEFACKCGCGLDDISLKTVNVCQKVRDFFDRPVSVNSGCRCRAHNASVGGAEESRHTTPYLDAADIVVEHVDAHRVYEYLDENAEELGIGGLGSYESFTHLDTRGHKARW